MYIVEDVKIKESFMMLSPFSALNLVNQKFHLFYAQHTSLCTVIVLKKIIILLLRFMTNYMTFNTTYMYIVFSFQNGHIFKLPE